MITIYNTLTRRKEEFRPITPGKVKMYVCGPTVYDAPHIGHARSAYVFEVVRAYLGLSGFDVLFARNVTDIDDKIIARAGQLKSSCADVAEKYLALYHDEMKKFGVRPPTKEPRATENIPRMIKAIELLVGKGFAYEAGGDVYFSVEKFPSYGKLSGQDTEAMESASRTEARENKRKPLDFALWKKSKEEEPSWESPWGKGRPGWHIECSVMSTSLLGETFDIHGGGLDLIFPHHENEIAQAECLTGRRFANYWMHNGLLSVEGRKMSKSLGNYITISDFLSRHGDADLLKIIFLASHYRSAVDYAEDKVKEAAASKERILIFFDKSADYGRRSTVHSPRSAKESAEVIKKLEDKFRAAMDDDFNTPVALSVIFEAVGTGNEYLRGKASGSEKAATAAALKNFILKAGDVFALDIAGKKVSAEEEKTIASFLAEREKARKKKDFKKADDIRKKLLEMGVVVEDSPEGPTWRKK